MPQASVSALEPVAEIEAPSGGWQLVYDGAWHDPVSGKRIEVRSPVDGSLIGTTPNADAADVEIAVSAARSAAKEWAQTAPRERLNVLHAFSERLIASAERLAWLDTVNAGIPISATRREVRSAAAGLVTSGYLAMELKGDTYPGTDGLAGFTRREPYGVVGAILAFNHPVYFFLNDVGPALAAGNSVVVKPAERTSLSALLMGEIAQEVLPPGLLNVVTGDGVTAGAAICAHPGIPRISFTGSIASGRAVLTASAAQIKHVTLELGGKNPLVILPDADIDSAVRMAVDGMNLRGVGGQSCQSCSRVLVHEALYPEFTEKLVTELRGIRVGDPRDEATEMGSMAFKEHYDRVMDYIRIGLSEGATLLTGGGVPKGLERGCFVEPTAFGDVTRSMRIATEEIFGPVISVMRWRDRGELLDIANGVDYGLTARIACGSVGEGLALASELQVGKVWVNEANGGPEGMPFGGYKQSGIGRSGGADGLLSYTQDKAVIVRI
jgi:betaine-aldehyde dehydrogenase